MSFTLHRQGVCLVGCYSLPDYTAIIAAPLHRLRLAFGVHVRTLLAALRQILSLEPAVHALDYLCGYLCGLHDMGDSCELSVWLYGTATCAGRVPFSCQAGWTVSHTHNTRPYRQHAISSSNLLGTACACHTWRNSIRAGMQKDLQLLVCLFVQQ